jgi:hypothetical protein
MDVADVVLVAILQAECDHFRHTLKTGIRIDITGPNRCTAHNATIPGAAENSEHIRGKAADHKLFRRGKMLWNRGKWIQISAKEQYKYLCRTYPGKYGIGRYSNRCHVDSRGVEARWVVS